MSPLETVIMAWPRAAAFKWMREFHAAARRPRVQMYFPVPPGWDLWPTWMRAIWEKCT